MLKRNKKSRFFVTNTLDCFSWITGLWFHINRWRYFWSMAAKDYVQFLQNIRPNTKKRPLKWVSFIVFLPKVSIETHPNIYNEPPTTILLLKRALWLHSWNRNKHVFSLSHSAASYFVRMIHALWSFCSGVFRHKLHQYKDIQLHFWYVLFGKHRNGYVHDGLKVGNQCVKMHLSAFSMYHDTFLSRHIQSDIIWLKRITYDAISQSRYISKLVKIRLIP